MTRVAVLGLGLLGSGFVEGLLARGGTTVVVWNRTPAKAEPLVALGATAAPSAAEAVRGADRVHLVLLDDDSVDATLADCQAALHPDAVVLDHTTNLPARVATRAAALTAAGIRYLHAPVMMGPAAAREAKGMMMVAGPEAWFEPVREALAEMTGTLWYVGERADLAAAYKLFGNATMLSVVAVLADVMKLADAMGVPRSGVLEMLATQNLNGPVTGRGQMMVTGQFTQSFTLDVARKDLRLMLEALNGVDAPMLQAFAARMDAGIAAGLAKEDFAVIGAPPAP